MADVHALLFWAEHGANDRCAHPVAFARPGRTLENLAIRDPNSSQQAIFFFAQIGVEVKGPGYVFVGSGLEKLGNRLSGDARGDVSGPVAAHAVGDDEKVVLLEDHERILILLALEPHVAQSSRDRPHQSAEPSNSTSLSPTLQGVKRVSRTLGILRKRKQSKACLLILRGCPSPCWRSRCRPAYWRDRKSTRLNSSHT